MTHHQPNPKNVLESVDAGPDFSAQNLWAPEFMLLEKDVAPGGFEVPSLRFLPFKIEFPGERDPETGNFERDSRFVSLAREAFQIENAIIREIRIARDHMSPSVAEAFQVELFQQPAIQSMLRRIGGLQEQQQQLAPGCFLGSKRCDSGLGAILEQQLTAAFTHVGLQLPEELQRLCAKWGALQGTARSEIIQATWAQLVNRGNWPVPTSFEDTMGAFLEGKDPSVDGKDPSARPDTFPEWLFHVECLAESAGSPVLEGSAVVRRWLSGKAQQSEADRAELMEDLEHLTLQFPVWGNFLRDPTFLRSPEAVQTHRLVEELFPQPEVRPFHIDFVNGVPHRLVISEQQALRWGSRYLPHCDPREITIRYSADPGDSSWRMLRRYPEVQALVNLPIAEFINCVEFDCFMLGGESCVEMFEHQLKFLKSYEENDAWRNNLYDRPIEVLFSNLSNRGPQDSLAQILDKVKDLRTYVDGLFDYATLRDDEVKRGAGSSASVKLTWIIQGEPNSD